MKIILSEWEIEKDGKDLILRNTFTASGDMAGIRANEGRIFTREGLLHTENVPSAELEKLPADRKSDKIGHVWGWWKRTPHINNTMAALVTKVVQEWHYGEWPTLVYGDPL